MNINLEIIGNVLIAMFLYNVIIKAIGSVILKEIMKTDKAKEVKKTFKERIIEKQAEV